MNASLTLKLINTEEKKHLLKFMYVFKGKRISVRIEGVRARDGKTVEKEIVEHPGAVVILPLLDNNKVVAIKQFRVAINDWIYELPAGTLDKKETPEECASRELEEETGYKAREIKEMFRMYSAPGYSSEIIYSFLAMNLEKGEQKLESSEVIYPIIVEFNELLSSILKEKVIDAKTISTLLFYKNFVGKF